jgi:hypothetical protein
MRLAGLWPEVRDREAVVQVCAEVVHPGDGKEDVHSELWWKISGPFTLNARTGAGGLVVWSEGGETNLEDLEVCAAEVAIDDACYARHIVLSS